MKNKIIISLVVLLLLSFFLQGIFEANSTISTSDIPSIKPSGENIVIAKSNVPSGDDQSVVKEKEPKPDFVNPHGTELSNVEKFNMKYQIKYESGETAYSSNVNMTGTENYSKVKGITTFRGNNYRDSAAYRNRWYYWKQIRKNLD